MDLIKQQDTQTMLKNTFLHISGIGEKTETQLWKQGILDWDSVKGHPNKLSAAKMETISQWIKTSRMHLSNKEYHFFFDHLPVAQHWRLYPELKGSCAFIDIETTGLDVWDAVITTIALYDGSQIKYYVNGRNLDDFVHDINQYDLIVTYNGKTFDVPFIESYFNTTMNQAHIDLRYVLGSLGYKGGLKKCEKALGMDRGDLDGVDGFFAVLLWQDFEKTGNEKSLETLLAYNIEDVVNLHFLMVTAFNMKLKQLLPDFEIADNLPKPVQPKIPFSPDLPTIERIKRQSWQY
ncbi:MAG: ribonuclease H-like domain-containing protein [Desulfobacula sp.]|nr:ribonuclease H-like domain-containing protein [Desulfobacula sp.]